MEPEENKVVLEMEDGDAVDRVLNGAPSICPCADALAGSLGRRWQRPQVQPCRDKFVVVLEQPYQSIKDTQCTGVV
jgi:hypothetical protein